MSLLLGIETEVDHPLGSLIQSYPIRTTRRRLTVRNPWPMRFVPTLIRAQWMYRVIFMLHAEYLVAEQAMIYASAQGLKGPRYWTWVDFVYRLSTKGVFRTYQVLFERFTRGRAKNFTSRIQARLQMGDERVVAHMD